MLRILKWTQDDKKVLNLLPQDWLLPWKEGVNHAPLDLLMPFLQWSFEYEKSGIGFGDSSCPSFPIFTTAGSKGLSGPPVRQSDWQLMIHTTLL